jgi:hypothetical protein
VFLQNSIVIDGIVKNNTRLVNSFVYKKKIFKLNY